MKGREIKLGKGRTLNANQDGTGCSIQIVAFMIFRSQESKDDYPSEMPLQFAY